MQRVYTVHAKMSVKGKHALVGCLFSYVVVRHALPRQVLVCDFKGDRELLSVHSQNMLFFDKVTTWYDCHHGCNSVTTYHWRRIHLQKIYQA